MRSVTAFLSLAAVASALPLGGQVRPQAEEIARRRAAVARVIQADRQPRAVLGLATSGTGAQDTLGVLVASVAADGPAAAAGIKVGDRLLAADGVSLRISAADAADPMVGNLGARRLTRALATRNAGDEVELRVQSGSQVRTVRTRLVDASSLARARAEQRQGAVGGGSLRPALRGRASLGIQVGSTGSRRDTLGVFVVRADDDGPAAQAGIIEGMRIAAIDGADLRIPPSDAEDNLLARSRVQRLIRTLASVNPGDEVELRVWQDGQYRNVRVRTVQGDSLRRIRGAFTIGEDSGIEGMGVLPSGIHIERHRPDVTRSF